ncbi:MAG TPA: glutamate synthase subunit alpha, partial [Beijerinckiaceae bacterium]
MTGYLDPALPEARGLFDPGLTRDSCGVGFIAHVKNAKSHDIVQQGLQILLNLDHRGAVGADPKLGDGCGILVQIPHRFFVEECAALGFELPDAGAYGVGQFFMPRDAAARAEAETIVARVLDEEGLTLLGWRDNPVDSSDLGDAVKACEPVMRQVFVGRGPGVTDEDDFERRLYVARKCVSNAIYALAR